jgi:hypothetical protein
VAEHPHAVRAKHRACVGEGVAALISHRSGESLRVGMKWQVRGLTLAAHPLWVHENPTAH